MRKSIFIGLGAGTIFGLFLFGVVALSSPPLTSSNYEVTVIHSNGDTVTTIIKGKPILMGNGCIKGEVMDATVDLCFVRQIIQYTPHQE